MSSIPELFQKRLYKRSEQKQNNTSHQLSSINGFSCDRRTVSALEHPVSSPPTLRAHPPRRYQEGRLPFPASPRGHYGMRKPPLDPRRSTSFVFSRRENTPYKSGLTPVRAPTIWTIFQTKSPPSHVTQPNDFLWLFFFFFSAAVFVVSLLLFFFALPRL